MKMYTRVKTLLFLSVFVWSGSLQGTEAAPAKHFDLAPIDTKEIRQILASDPQQNNQPDIETPEAWEKKRETLKKTLWEFMGESSNTIVPEPKYSVLEEVMMPNYRQVKISYLTEPDEEVRAYLLIPHKPNGAGVLCIHGTSAEGKETQLGVERLHNRDLGRFLANHGFVTLSPDSLAAGERFSDLDKRPYETARFQEKNPNWSAVGKSVWDNSRALDILQTVSEVDPARMGTIGHSLGGYSSIWLAAFDERVRSTVSNCGLSSWQANPRRYEFARQQWYVHFPKLRDVFAKNDAEGGLLPLEMYEYAALIAPRAFLNISGMTDKTYGNNETMPAVGLQLNALWNLLGESGKFGNFLMGAAHDIPDYSRLLALGWLEVTLGVTSESDS